MHARRSHLDRLLVTLLVQVKITQLQTLRPVTFMEVHQHRLLQLCLAVVHGNGVVMPVQSVNESLYRRLVDVAYVRSRLAWFLARDDGVWVDQTEGIDDDLSFDGLDRVDDNGDGSRVERLEGLQARRQNTCLKKRSNRVITCWVLISTLDSQQPKPG